MEEGKIYSKPSASYEQHRNFAASLIWEDFRREIVSWREDIRDALETEENPIRLYRLQGVAEACKEFLTLPERIEQDYATEQPDLWSEENGTERN